MSVDIKKLSDEELSVNGKRVYKDSNDKWVGQNLNNIESKAANEYIASLERYNDKKNELNESTRS